MSYSTWRTTAAQDHRVSLSEQNRHQCVDYGQGAGREGRLQCRGAWKVGFGIQSSRSLSLHASPQPCEAGIVMSVLPRRLWITGKVSLMQNRPLDETWLLCFCIFLPILTLPSPTFQSSFLVLSSRGGFLWNLKISFLIISPHLSFLLPSPPILSCVLKCLN